MSRRTRLREFGAERKKERSRKVREIEHGCVTKPQHLNEWYSIAVSSCCTITVLQNGENSRTWTEVPQRS